MYLFNYLESWHWLTLSFLLLAIETLGAGGFLLGSAGASVLIAAVIWLIPALGWTEQLSLFAIFSIIFTVGYWKLFRKENNKSDYPELNNRASQLIGRVFELDQDLLPGHQKRIQLGDTLWRVQSNKPLWKNSVVEGVGSEDMLLIIDGRKNEQPS